MRVLIFIQLVEHAENGDVTAMKATVQTGADINYTSKVTNKLTCMLNCFIFCLYIQLGEYCHTPLTACSAEGHLEAVQLLLLRKAIGLELDISKPSGGIWVVN